MAQEQSAAEAANYLHVRNDWLARRKEPILEPDLPIIDPHHHLWDRENWRYLLDDLLADTNSGHNILATVFVQARAMLRADGPEEMKPVGEVEFVNGVAAMTASGIYGKIRACAGIVGHADLMLGGARRAGARGAGARRRRALPRHPPHHRVGRRSERAQSGQSGGARNARPTRNSARASRCWRGSGTRFDAWLYHPQLDELTSLADAFPDAKIVLNHCGGIVNINAYKRDEVFPRWKKSIEALAKRPNVYVKLGGLGMRMSGYGFEKLRRPAILAGARRRVAALHRDLHRGLRTVARDVRKQFPGRQGLVQLPGVLERLQAARQGRERRREGRPVRRDCEAVLSARRHRLIVASWRHADAHARKSRPQPSPPSASAAWASPAAMGRWMTPRASRPSTPRWTPASPISTPAISMAPGRTRCCCATP